MTFFNWLKKQSPQGPQDTAIVHKLKQAFPQHPEDKLGLLGAMAGLMAWVAYVDMEITQEEIQAMEKALQQFSHLTQEEAECVTKIACEDMRQLSGIDNHHYCEPLATNLSEAERFGILKTLFAIAASDGEASNYESEEIRTISKGLLLSTEQFIQARASVIEYLGVIKMKRG